jgi:glycosyltransferase involved in cell wall biosynthesis
MPFFSIIIPSYNRSAQIGTALNSLIKQSVSDFEIIIVDDGSVDDTKEIVLEFSRSYSFIRYIHQDNNGVCSARNTGAKMAQGLYLIFLDSDDEVEANWLHDFCELLKNNNYEIGFCNMKQIDKGNNIKWVDASNPYNNSNKKGKYIAGMFAIRSEIFKEVGMYDENIKYGENTELGIRLRIREATMGFINQYNFIYNKSVGTESKNNLNKLNSNVYTVNKHPEYFAKNPVTKKLFLQVAAVAAARLGMQKKANDIFKGLLKENKRDVKLWLQYLITLNSFLTKMKWR